MAGKSSFFSSLFTHIDTQTQMKKTSVYESRIIFVRSSMIKCGWMELVIV